MVRDARKARSRDERAREQMLSLRVIELHSNHIDQ